MEILVGHIIIFTSATEFDGGCGGYVGVCVWMSVSKG